MNDYDETTGLPDVDAIASGTFKLAYLYPYQRFVIAGILDAAGIAGVPPYGRPRKADRPRAGESERPLAPGEATEYDLPVRRVVLLPTGAGKSLCFQLPAVCMDACTVVVYPLLSLMEDQRRRLAELGIPCVSLRGGMSPAEIGAAEAELVGKRARIALTNPETLTSGRMVGFFRTLGIGHLVIDEAHCVAEWGDTFRKAYLALRSAVETLAPSILTAFTATASPSVLSRMTEVVFGDDRWSLIAGDPDRPNIRYSALRCLSKSRTLRKLASTVARPAIFFASTRERTRSIAFSLRSALTDERIRFYHAGLSKEEKGETERWFHASEDGILVATCAYGMGVDKKDIRTVVHADAPSSCEAYLQESGRAGRDGRKAEALLLVGIDERGGSGDGRRDALVAYGVQSQRCRRTILLELMGCGEIACSGCDVCDGAVASPEGLVAATSALRANRRRFTRTEFSSFLSGDRGVYAPFEGRGCLRGWDGRECAEAVDRLVDSGLARERSSFLFREMLDLAEDGSQGRSGG